MNKLTSAKKTNFFPLVGSSRSEKFHNFLVGSILVLSNQHSTKIFTFINNTKLFIVKCKEKKLKTVHVVDFDLMKYLPNSGTNCLLIFDDSCEEVSNSKHFVQIATAGRHSCLNTIYIKYILFHQSYLGRDVEIQNKYIVLFKSPRDGLQIDKLVQQLGLRSQLKE